MKSRNVIVAIGVVFIIMFIIVPIPTFLLDFLFIINLALSLIVLLNSIYAGDTLAMSSFPTVLLFATLFRLALNVASTRLILGEGEAGKVIQGFGEFVGGNNLVLGVVVFLVIMIVQFMVITKGTERVSEVAARFTLDAMPGKQMAIDADLNSGLISEEEAKERRKKVQREADFYGAMDGAAKFVKNDAISGILVVFINIIGGIIMGMIFLNKPFEEAINLYSILTIGNGLVTQISALMTALATGVIVTRAASDGDLGDEIIGQLFNSPRVLYVAGAGCFLLVPVLRQLTLILVGGGLIFLGYQLKNKTEKVTQEEEQMVEEQEVEEIRKPENVVSLLQVDPIELEFGYAIIPLADKNQG